MLSMQRGPIDTYSQRNGMRNLVFTTGIISELGKRGGELLQTRYENLALPFVLNHERDSMPRWVKLGNPVKITGRFEGGRHPETGEPTGLIRVMYFDFPRVVDLPPAEAWDISIRKGIAQSDIAPTVGQTGLSRNPNANVAWIAGFVAGARLRRAGSLTETGQAGRDCLYILLQQTADPKEAIPIRLYGKFSALHERAIRIGSPIQVRSGTLRVDAKPTGKIEEDGTEEVHRYMFVQTSTLHTATKDDIEEIPDWARTMAEEANELRKSKARRAATSSEATEASDEEAAASSAARTPARAAASASSRKAPKTDASGEEFVDVSHLMGDAAVPAK